MTRISPSTIKPHAHPRTDMHSDHSLEQIGVLRRISDSSKNILRELKRLKQKLMSHRPDSSLDPTGYFRPIQRSLEAQMNILRAALTQAQDHNVRAALSENNLRWLQHDVTEGRIHQILGHAHKLSQIAEIPDFFAQALIPQLQALRALLIPEPNDARRIINLSDLSKPNPAEEILQKSHAIKRIINSEVRLGSKLTESAELAAAILLILRGTEPNREFVNQTRNNIEKSLSALNRIAQKHLPEEIHLNLDSTIKLLKQIESVLNTTTHNTKTRVQDEHNPMTMITAVKRLKAGLKPGATKNLEPALQSLISLARETEESSLQIFTTLYQAYRVFNQRVRQLDEDPIMVESKRTILLTALREVYSACPQEPIIYKNGMQTRVLTVKDVLAELASGKDRKKHSTIEVLLSNINRIFNNRSFAARHGLRNLRDSLQSIVVKLKHSVEKWPMVFDNLLDKASFFRASLVTKVNLKRREALALNLVEGALLKTAELSNRDRFSQVPLTQLVS